MTDTAKNNLNADLVSVGKLLSNKGLMVPEYQRPYKWTLKNVNQLIDDILLHHEKGKSAYRLGTLVLNSNADSQLEIVDGQQRTITLTLISHAIHSYKAKELKELSRERSLETEAPKTTGLCIYDSLSQHNIQQNYKEIARRTGEFSKEAILFFYQKCQLVQVTLQNNISEAFQFFDSQNARGRDLNPHDLLKAFHLREMADSTTEHEKLKCVESWENMDSKNLAHLFGDYLYRIRQWSKGNSARYFTKNEVDVFKGVSPEVQEPYPFAAMCRIVHYYTEEYNRSHHRYIAQTISPYPFQLDGILMNGKRFFELVGHYQQLLRKVEEIDNSTDVNNKTAANILHVLKVYEGRHRTGDTYVRNLFNCALLYYFDKFGEAQLERAIEKLFIWAYALRLKMKAVQLASIDNHALGQDTPQVFTILREALRPSDLLNTPLPALTENRATKVKEVESIFRDLHYLL